MDEQDDLLKVSHWKVRCGLTSAYDWYLEIDGEDFSARLPIAHMSVDFSAGNLTEMKITLIPRSVDIDAIVALKNVGVEIDTTLLEMFKDLEGEK